MLKAANGMFIYEYARCVKCDALYYGQFRLTPTGETQCIDCAHPIKLQDDLTFTPLSPDDAHTDNLYIKLYLEDTQYLYPIIRSADDGDATYCMDADGNIDLAGIFFQGTDLNKVYQLRTVAYECLRYIELNADQYADYAYQVINTYLGLRLAPPTPTVNAQIKALLVNPAGAAIRQVI